jgi:coniferyl-aldehyde dehydrogenase
MNSPHFNEDNLPENNHMFSVFNQQNAAFQATPYPDLDSRRSKLFN